MVIQWEPMHLKGEKPLPFEKIQSDLEIYAQSNWRSLNKNVNSGAKAIHGYARPIESKPSAHLFWSVIYYAEFHNQKACYRHKHNMPMKKAGGGSRRGDRGGGWE